MRTSNERFLLAITDASCDKDRHNSYICSLVMGISLLLAYRKRYGY